MNLVLSVSSFWPIVPSVPSIIVPSFPPVMLPVPPVVPPVKLLPLFVEAMVPAVKPVSRAVVAVPLALVVPSLLMARPVLRTHGPDDEPFDEPGQLLGLPLHPAATVPFVGIGAGIVSGQEDDASCHDCNT